MRKIDFLVLGVQKAGSSALDQYLREHPKIGMAQKKELHFFDNENLFAQETVDYSIYERNFDWHLNKKVYGEATPIYIYWRSCCRRIWEYNKNIKLIILLRNPIERAFSHWTMEFNRKADKATFNEAIKNERVRSMESLPYQHRIFSYIDRGFYSEQIRRVRSYFLDDQLLFIKYDEFRENPQDILNRVFSFLGIENKLLEKVNKVVHQGNYKFEMSQEQKQFLLNIFENDISEVERLLDWDCSDWRN